MSFPKRERGVIVKVKTTLGGTKTLLVASTERENTIGRLVSPAIPTFCLKIQKRNKAWTNHTKLSTIKICSAIIKKG